MKRHLLKGDRISPPPVKRKIESNTTSKTSGFVCKAIRLESADKAVANFFKPSSQKEPEKVQWRVVDNSLLVGMHSSNKDERLPDKRRKIAAFDFVTPPRRLNFQHKLTV